MGAAIDPEAHQKHMSVGTGIDLETHKKGCMGMGTGIDPEAHQERCMNMGI